MQDAKPLQVTARGGYRKERASNLELYRIICMLMIVAHHYVVNSGLTSVEGPMIENPNNIKTYFLWLFGMWGKTGINCFLMITGYFMCKSKITLKKFLKLLLEVYFYKVVIYAIFLLTSFEPLSISRVVKVLMPVWDFEQNFVSCFIGFWLTIPFLNILINNMDARKHRLLLWLLLGMNTVLGSIPKFNIAINYVTWFGIIYLIASYVRIYPNKIFENKRLWAWATVISVVLAMLSVLVMCRFGKGHYFFVADSNKVFAVVVAFCSFLWFKNLKIKQSKIINLIGASTFGVLLIHANSDSMRTWLWKKTVDCVGHYDLSLSSLILFSFAVVFAVFFVCIAIDIVRIKALEKPLFKEFDKKIEKWQARLQAIRY